MQLKHLASWLIVLFFIASGCKKGPVIIIDPNAGANFSRYISVGNSLTAGYSNGGLYLEGQQFAYPNLIAEQLKTVGGGNFSSPYFPAEQSNGSGYLRLAGFNPDGSPIIVPVTDKLAIRGIVNITGFGNVTLYTKYSGELNNYGVPGLKLQQITYAPLGNLNGYYERLLPGQAGENSTPYLDFVTAKPFTFFSCWLGNNDALGYATSGGEGDSLTDKSQFAALYNLAITTLTKNKAKGVVATLPNITSIPFLNTITVNALLESVKKVNPLVSAIYINALNPATGKYTARAATVNDLIVLSFSTSSLGSVVNGIPGYGLTPLNPLMSKEVLDEAEVTKVQDYVSFYNATIKSIADANNLALFDAYDFLNKVKAGMVVNGVQVNASFITGGVFSLDGVHLTPRGNALAADEFIKAINAEFHCHIPLIDISKYKGVI